MQSIRFLTNCELMVTGGYEFMDEEWTIPRSFLAGEIEMVSEINDQGNGRCLIVFSDESRAEIKSDVFVACDSLEMEDDYDEGFGSEDQEFDCD